VPPPQPTPALAPAPAALPLPSRTPTALAVPAPPLAQTAKARQLRGQHPVPLPGGRTLAPPAAWLVQLTRRIALAPQPATSLAAVAHATQPAPTVAPAPAAITKAAAA
jgi:hypothetical protein